MAPLKKAALAYSHIYETDDPAVHLMEFRFITGKGVSGSIRVPASLRSHPNRIVELLDGADATNITVDVVRAAIEGLPAKRRKLTRATGWHGDEFVLEHETISLSTTPHVFHETAIYRPGVAKEGSKKSWRKGLRDAFTQSSYLTFAACLGLTGPILRDFDPATGLVFVFAGDSGAGKTMGIAVALSLSEAPKVERMSSLDTTRTALEETAVRRNELFLGLDETGNIYGTPAGKELFTFVAFGLREGRGRRRAQVGQQSLGYDDRPFRVASLLTSEKLLAEFGDWQKGFSVRVIEIAVPDKDLGGVFDRLQAGKGSYFERSGRLASSVKSVLRENYGAVLPAFVRRLMRKPKLAAKVNDYREEFVSRMIASGVSPLHRRGLEAFGSVFAAGKLACTFKLMPFSEEDAYVSIREMFMRSGLVQSNGGVSFEREVGELLALSSDRRRCTDVSKNSAALDNRAGELCAISRVWKKRKVMGVLPSYIENLVGATRLNAFVDQLKTKQVLIVESGRKGTRLMQATGLIPGEDRPALYCFDLERLRELERELPASP